MAEQRHPVHMKWVILAASFLNMFLCVGFPLNLSVLNVEFLNAFGKSQAETAAIQSVTIGLFLSAGVISGLGVNKFGVRIMGICGGLVSSLGLILSFFATSIPFLIVTLGAVTGLGLSAAYVSSTTVVGMYFEGRAKFIAVSFVYFGAGCGGMTFTLLFDILIQAYGWRGCLLITGGMMGNMVCFSALCKPISVAVSKDMSAIASKQQSVISQKEATATKYSTFNIDALPISNRIHPSSEEEVKLINSQENQHGNPGRTTFTDQFKLLLSNYIFIIVIMATALTISAFNSLMIFLVEFFMTKGFDDQTALLLYFYMTVSNAFGRLVPGLCRTIPHVGDMAIPALFSLMGAVVNITIATATTYTEHVILSLGFGVAFGSNVASMSMTTLELVGVQNYSLGFGMLITTVGISNVCAGPVSGWLRDITGSYSASFYSSAGAHVIAGGLYALAATISKCKHR